MRKKRKWYKLKTILPALVILPPLGLLLLWLSPRTNKAKTVITVIYVLLLSIGAVFFLRSDYYGTWVHPRIPASGFDVSRNKQGRYAQTRVFPFEQQIFNEVVYEEKRLSQSSNWTTEQGLAIYSSDPETMAVNIVAKRHNLEPEDVSSIYLKVTSHLFKK